MGPVNPKSSIVHLRAAHLWELKASDLGGVRHHGRAPPAATSGRESASLTFEVPHQEADKEGDEQEDDQHSSHHHPSLWATLLHLLGIHGGEELHPLLHAVHVLGRRIGDTGLESSLLQAYHALVPGLFGAEEQDCNLRDVGSSPGSPHSFHEREAQRSHSLID